MLAFFVPKLSVQLALHDLLKYLRKQFLHGCHDLGRALKLLNDRILTDFLNMESSLIVMHIQSVDQVSAIKTVKRKITDLDRAKIEEQKKAVRAGYNMDIIPTDLATYSGEVKKLLQDLQSRNERMFLVTVLIANTADPQGNSI